MPPLNVGRWLMAGLIGLGLASLSAGGLLAQAGLDLPGAGSAVFQRWCSTCHGDQGQGLTPEWRATWPPDHQNCSPRYCHGPDHAPGVAHIPSNTVPAVIGPGRLGRFETPESLFYHTRRQMPRGWEGHLTRQEYWALTVFLLQHKGLEVITQPPFGGAPPPAWPAWKQGRLEGMD